MNALEARLQYPFGDALPAPGETLEVAKDLRWLRMALPFQLNHINLWLLRDELDGREGWTVVDCCISRDESKAQWESIFETQLQGLPILRVLVTHMHPDHVGLAYWLCERWNAPLWISATDFNAARMASQSTTGFGGAAAAGFFASHGMTDPESMEKIKARASYYPSLVPDVPRRFRRLLDGEAVRIGGREWRCIGGYGHAPEHISLHCAELGVLISGDMLLPRISTNVSVYDVEPESNPLRLFLQSIEKFLPLPADTLVLPSHGRPFRGLHERVRQLQEHHDERLREVIEACEAGPQSAAQVLPVLFKRQLDLHQTTFAMGETIAHLHALWYDGLLARQRDSEGVWRFSLTRAAASRP
jgi:glyoxylase-like metal-dependent hydrolase (beta-lactamase superfamily II)